MLDEFTKQLRYSFESSPKKRTKTITERLSIKRTLASLPLRDATQPLTSSRRNNMAHFHKNNLLIIPIYLKTGRLEKSDLFSRSNTYNNFQVD